jgi:hypothetical protein
MADKITKRNVGLIQKHANEGLDLAQEMVNLISLKPRNQLTVDFAFVALMQIGADLGLTPDRVDALRIVLAKMDFKVDCISRPVDATND